MSDVRSKGSRPEPHLLRGMGLVDSTALVVGSMIGSGIFIVSAESARVLGSPGWLLAAWAIAGILTMIAALSCAELAAMLPKAGGQYVFFREAYGPLFGFLFGWTMFLVIQSGTIAAVAVAFAKFLGVLWPAISGSNKILSLGTFSISTVQAAAIAVIALLTASNATGLKTGTWTQNIFTLAKLAGASRTDDSRPLERERHRAVARRFRFLESGVADVRKAHRPRARRGGRHRDGGAALFAVGLEQRHLRRRGSAGTGQDAAPGAPSRVPPRDGNLRPRQRLLFECPFPREIQHAPEDRVATAAATSLFGSGAASAMAAAIMVSTFGCVNGLILSGARVCFAMARDGMFFRALSRVNRSAVPGNALWAQAAWSAVLVLSGSYSSLLKYVISADILFYVLLVVAVIVLRVKRPDLPRPFRAPGYPYLPLFYAAAGLLLIAVLLAGNPKTTWPGYALVATGVPVYFLWKRRALPR